MCHEVVLEKKNKQTNKQTKTKVGRGPFEQCVGRLLLRATRWCKIKKEKQNVPRGGVRKEKSVGDRLGSMSGSSALCHEVA